MRSGPESVDLPTWPRLEEPLDEDARREVIRTIRAVKRLRRRILWTWRSIKERQPYIPWFRYLGLPSSLVRVLAAPFEIAAALWRSGPSIRKTVGIPLVRQLVQMSGATFRWGLKPREYYLNGLFKPGAMRRAPLFITSRDNVEILLCLNSRWRPRMGKDEFHEICVAHGLPTIPILAECRAGADEPLIHDPDSPDWEGDLCSKPSHGTQGGGLRMWRRGEDGSYRDGADRLGSRGELLTHLLDGTPRDATVVQPRRWNHPDLAAISGGALCGIRIDTVKAPGSGDIEILFAMLRMSRGDAVADNVHLGSYAAPVDLETGTLGVARRVTAGGLDSTYEVHPDTGNSIPGRTVPFWQELLELVARAHSVFPEPCLAWDVAVGESGPFLIETNRCWECDLIQAATDTPLGVTSYPKYMLHYLKAEAMRRRMERG